MAGTTLAACGVALLTASQMIWPETGLIWRAGVICAIMKSISPSAVILGPMIGILTEALVVQVCVLVLGRNRLGLLVGGMLALLEPAIHLVGELIIAYGLNAGVLYMRLYEFAAHTLRITVVGPLDVVAAYFVLHLVIGLGAVMLGMAVAKRALTVQAMDMNGAADTAPRTFPPVKGTLVYHPILLVAHFAILSGGFMLIRRIPLWQSAAAVVVYGAFCLWRYANIRRVFRRPRLWIELLVVGILASLLLGNLSSGEAGWTWKGLELGLQMALRAILVTVAFASIGTELRNPRIIDWFMRRGLGTLSSSTTLAFAALPTMMAALSQEKQIIRHPVQSLARVLGTGIRWLDDYSGNRNARPRIFIVSGESGSGKTTLLTKLTATLVQDGKKVGGILQPTVWENGERVGYDVVNLRTDERRCLCRTRGISGTIIAGKYHFDPDAIAFGNAALAEAQRDHVDLMIVDEIGILEQAEQGWSDALRRILRDDGATIILSVRPSLVEAVAQQWGFVPVEVFHTGQTELGAMLRAVERMKDEG